LATRITHNLTVGAAADLRRVLVLQVGGAVTGQPPNA
jgi:hypothetical protein